MATDLHTETAAKIYGVDVADVTPEMRKVGKIANYNDIYRDGVDYRVIYHGNVPAPNSIMQTDASVD